MYGKGYQQTRVLIYSVSGGLLGVGIGDGKLKEVPAATEDLVFGMICEEWGIIMGILVILCIMFIAFHSIRCASGSRSAFYAISGIAAGSSRRDSMFSASPICCPLRASPSRSSAEAVRARYAAGR